MTKAFQSYLSNGTAKASKTVMKYIADQANKRQRQLVGWKRKRMKNVKTNQE